MTASRRLFLSSTTILGAGVLVQACRSTQGDSSARGPAGARGDPCDPPKPDDRSKQADKADASEEVTATEDLMREHGVLRRALIVYREAADRLRIHGAPVPPEALQRTAKLFRSFGEDYHERKLEEAYIFPAVKGAGGSAASYPDVLLAQHDRGRAITDYVLAATQGAKIGAGAVALANVLDGFVRMYDAHTAIEDTIVFPAWKKTLSPKKLDEMGDKFEAIERETFGKDGFDDAVERIASIEGLLGLSDLSKLTAPPPPSGV
jgi:hemerythrin-like domain-containing protein